MGLFNRKKEVKESKQECGCGCDCQSGTNDVKVAQLTSVKVLGGGCAKCNQLEANTAEAMKELGIDLDIIKVKDYAEIAAMGVMSTPALAFNEQVVSYGKVIKKEEIVKIISNL